MTIFVNVRGGRQVGALLESITVDQTSIQRIVLVGSLQMKNKANVVDGAVVNGDAEESRMCILNAIFSKNYFT